MQAYERHKYIHNTHALIFVHNVPTVQWLQFVIHYYVMLILLAALSCS